MEKQQLPNKIISCSVNHLIVVFLLQGESLRARAVELPSLAQQGEEEWQVEAGPRTLGLFSQFPFLPISFELREKKRRGFERTPNRASRYYFSMEQETPEYKSMLIDLQQLACL